MVHVLGEFLGPPPFGKGLHSPARFRNDASMNVCIHVPERKHEIKVHRFGQRKQQAFL